MSAIGRKQYVERCAEWLAVALGAIVLCFPAFLNHSAYIFPDSDSYYRGGQSLLAYVSGKKSNEPAVNSEQPASQPATENAGERKSKNIDATVFLARSPFYGIVVYLTSQSKGFWSLVALQALAASLALFQVARAFAASRPLIAFCTMIATVALASSLPWYVSFVMPDVWLGIAILFWTALAFGDRPLNTVTFLTSLGLITAAALFHQSNWLIISSGIVLAPIIALKLKLGSRKLYAMVAGAVIAVMLGLAGNWTFGYLIQRHYGEPIRQPIFATARVLADGFGREYLKESCARDPAKYVLCRYNDRPLDNTEEILWSSNPSRGVYTVADYDTRTALAEEQWRFVMGALVSDPLRAVSEAIGNAFEQLTRFSLVEFRNNNWINWSKSDYWSHQKIFDAIPDSASCIQSPASCQAPAWISLSDIFQRAVFVLSCLVMLAVVGSYFTAREGVTDIHRRLAAAGILLLLLLSVNAIICGALSGPSDRYQARLSWMFPAFASLVIVLRLWRKTAVKQETFVRPSFVSDS